MHFCLSSDLVSHLYVVYEGKHKSKMKRVPDPRLLQNRRKGKGKTAWTIMYKKEMHYLQYRYHIVMENGIRTVRNADNDLLLYEIIKLILIWHTDYQQNKNMEFQVKKVGNS